jgi:hypothetical protein
MTHFDKVRIKRTSIGGDSTVRRPNTERMPTLADVHMFWANFTNSGLVRVGAKFCPCQRWY